MTNAAIERRQDNAPTVPHFRIVYPARFVGHKHAAFTARVYITLPGMSEVLLPGTQRVAVDSDIDNPGNVVKLRLLCSAEIQYEDADV